MRIHHLNCGTDCPLGGALFDGRSVGPLGRLVCHCLLIETDAHGLVLVDTGYGLRDVAHPHRHPGPRITLPWRMMLISGCTNVTLRFGRSRRWVSALATCGTSSLPTSTSTMPADWRTSRTRPCTSCSASMTTRTGRARASSHATDGVQRSLTMSDTGGPMAHVASRGSASKQSATWTGCRPKS